MSKTRHWKPSDSGTQGAAPSESSGDLARPRASNVPGAPRALHSIMVIDDDEDLIALWELGFEQLGIEAVCHTTAESAMSDAELWEVDLIVTDLDLPRANGPALIARVRKERPDVPILCVTGSRDRDLIRQAFAAGAYDCVLKPCGASEIVSRALKGGGKKSVTGRMGSAIEGTPYLVDRVIGEGGAGLVYAGIHMDLGRRVAVKITKLGVSPAHTRQVLAEARVLESLRSKHIPAVLDFRELPDGRAMYVMEFIEGETLHAHQHRRGPLPLTDALGILDQVLEGVALAHQKGIVHLDLKPENLILSHDDAGNLLIKILDFGLASVAGADVLGCTPGWASPEQARGEACDQRSDVFNAGLLLECMLTGQAPREGRSFKPALLPAELEDFQLKALAWWIEKSRREDPQKRFEDAGAARTSLSQAFDYFRSGGR